MEPTNLVPHPKDAGDDEVKAVVVRRMVEGEPQWGFESPEGFARFGSSSTAKKDSVEGAHKYNEGMRGWIYLPISECPLAPEDQITDAEIAEELRDCLTFGYVSKVIIREEDEAEGKRVIAGWPEDRVREFAQNWIARAEARQRLADDAIRNLRTALARIRSQEATIQALKGGK